MFRWIAFVLVLSLVACTSSSTLPSGVTQVSAQDLPALGGSFSASFSGGFTASACQMLSSPGRFRFKGFGFATFIRKAIESGKMTENDNTCLDSWFGSALIISKFNRANTVTVSLTTGRYGPCTQGADWTVTGGTGKFAHATGSGTVFFTCNSNGTYTDGWSGALHF